MSDAKHTPSPWAVALASHDARNSLGAAYEIKGAADAGGYVAVAVALGTGPACQITPETVANANLIHAAPDLLAACELAAGLECYIDPANYDGHAAHAFKSIDAAIRKARGT